MSRRHLKSAKSVGRADGAVVLGGGQADQRGQETRSPHPHGIVLGCRRLCDGRSTPGAPFKGRRCTDAQVAVGRCDTRACPSITCPITAAVAQRQPHRRLRTRTTASVRSGTITGSHETPPTSCRWR